MTSSDWKVKKARFYEFLFTLGWRWIENKSLYKFPAPKHVSFRKYSNLNFRIFTVRDTEIGNWCLIESLTISNIKRCVYAHVCQLSSEKEELLWKKWTPHVFVDFRRPSIWRLHTKLCKGAWNVSANTSETVGHKDLRFGQIVYILVFYNISFFWLLPLDGF